MASSSPAFRASTYLGAGAAPVLPPGVLYDCLFAFHPFAPGALVLEDTGGAAEEVDPSLRAGQVAPALALQGAEGDVPGRELPPLSTLGRGCPRSALTL